MSNDTSRKNRVMDHSDLMRVTIATTNFTKEYFEQKWFGYEPLTSEEWDNVFNAVQDALRKTREVDMSA